MRGKRGDTSSEYGRAHPARGLAVRALVRLGRGRGNRIPSRSRLAALRGRGAGLWIVVVALAFAGVANAQQVGSLVSPGPLSKAHARLEGLDNCQKCHEPGKQVTPAKCLACHRPIADRIAAKKGVHRDAAASCISCHIEHAGADAAITRFDRTRFDHAKETGFPLDGKHAGLACATCHKTRAYLAATPACSSCHADVHRGALGPDCAKCHSASLPFKETRKAFDHDRTAFKLTGAHAEVKCEQCHRTAGYRIARFAACADCHRDPHRKPLGVCETCHTTESFRAQKIDHARTGYPLLGAHAAVPCAKCHVQSAVKVRLSAGRCADCHRDPHRGVFKEDCASCHRESGFARGIFDHAARTRFPLDGRHSAIPCASCHPRPAPKGADAGAVDFRGLKTECASCHADVHKGELGNACQKCHSARSFRIETFAHPRRPEFFAAGHATVACEKCHGAKSSADRRFARVPFTCASCHKDVHRGQVGAACESCHSVAGKKFAPDLFSHTRSRFPLTGKHTALACEKCHGRETAAFPGGTGPAMRLQGLSLDCAGCHKDPHLGQMSASCASCHSTESFTIARYVHRDKTKTAFFTGSHAAVACASCHKKTETDFPGGRGPAVLYSGTPTSCGSCHGDPHRGVLGLRCESCHSLAQAWKNASRAFHKIGVFPLEGRHLLVPCEACHLKGVIKGTPTRCFDCHWIRRQDDPYRTRLGNQCEACHRPTAWAMVVWNHGAQTGFPLNGAHATQPCEACHRNQAFAAATARCVSCHQKDYDRSANPNHVAAGFPTTCESCHKASDASWRQATFNHAAVYPLLGVHATQPCSGCHANNVYRGTPTDCYACHQNVYHQAANPSHIAAGFGTTCQSCHKPSDPTWQLGTFNHTAVYPLFGVHATQPCSSCHANNVFKGTSTDCYACHQNAYHQAANPSHVAAGFGTTCQSCHKPSDPTWQLGTFNHAPVYPLLGVHATQPCAACHGNNVFKGTSTDCFSCHQTQYQAAANPNHVSAGFPTTCQSCHKASDATWQQGTFDHSTLFPLVGVHATQPCTACHVNNVFAGTPTDCYSCHKTQYQQTTNPNHLAAGFPTTCQSCHKASDASWQQATFDHSTLFPLLGVHATQPCTACHINNIYKGTPTDCYSCHKTQYQQTTNPNHLAAGFPTTCQSCHKASDATWQLGVFNHSTFYALVGVHATQPCSACHVNNVYKGTPTDCYSCHKTQYQKTTNPNHVAAGFPTTCQNCHRASDASWQQGVFNHTWFPITSGPHAGNPCSVCHTNPLNFAVFTCLTCHDRATTDSHHSGVAGYQYSSPACYSCHPTGRSGG